MTWDDYGRLSDGLVGAVALASAFMIFVRQILSNVEFTVLFVGRALLAIGVTAMGYAFLIAAVGHDQLNGTYIRVAGYTIVLSAFIFSLLLVTRWCEREDKTYTVAQALWRHIRSIFGGAFGWLCGPRRMYPEDPGSEN